MKYPRFITTAFNKGLYFYYHLSGIASKKVLIKSERSEVVFNNTKLPQREFVALSKRGKEMAQGKVMLGRFIEYKYHYCIFNGTVVNTLYRRRNLGAKLVLARIQFCKKEGFDFVFVPVKADNNASLNMLTSCGFVFPDKKDWMNVMTKEADFLGEENMLIGVLHLKDK